MPPMNWGMGQARIDDPARREHAEHARDAHLAGGDVERTSANWAPNAYGRGFSRDLRNSAVSAVAFTPPRAARRRTRRAARAARAAGEHDRRAPRCRARAAAALARGKPLSPTLIVTRSIDLERVGGDLRSTVRAPVPMSAAAIGRRSRCRGSAGRHRRHLLGRIRRARDAHPVQPAAVALRGGPGLQPQRSAPSRRQVTRLRELALAVLGVQSGSLRILTHRVQPAACASSSSRTPARTLRALAGRAHPRRVGTSMATSRCAVRRFGAAYIQQADRRLLGELQPRGLLERLVREPPTARPRRTRAAAAGSSACGSP